MYVSVCVSLCVYMCVCIYVYVCVCMYVYIYIYMYVYVHIYVCVSQFKHFKTILNGYFFCWSPFDKRYTYISSFAHYTDSITLSPFISIVNRSRKVLKTAPSVRTEQMNTSISWSTSESPHENLTFLLISLFPAHLLRLASLFC